MNMWQCLIQASQHTFLQRAGSRATQLHSSRATQLPKPSGYNLWADSGAQEENTEPSNVLQELWGLKLEVQSITSSQVSSLSQISPSHLCRDQLGSS